MTALEVAQTANQHGVQVFRPRKDAPGQYDAKPYFTGSHRGWVILDAFTASAIVQVHAALNETNKATFASLPLLRMAAVAFKLIKVRT